MSNKKQSSVEWLKQRVLYIVPSSQKDDLIKLFEQAEDMHKAEITETASTYFHECTGLTPEQYYNDTFNNHE